MALTAKQEAFCKAVVSGMSQADAYRTSYDATRMTSKTVQEKASRLMADGKVRARVAELRRPLIESAQAKFELTVERILQEVARLSLADPRRLFREDGSLRPIHELDADTAAMIASVEVDEIKADGAVIGVTKKVKLWDKNAALEKAMKHLGQYEKDNAQRHPIQDLEDDALTRLIQRKAKEAGVRLH